VKIKVTRQDAIALFHLGEDDGQWFATCCASGLMKLLGRKVEKGEKIIVEISAKEIKG
jgi:hypothetical protein